MIGVECRFDCGELLYLFYMVGVKFPIQEQIDQGLSKIYFCYGMAPSYPQTSN